MICSSSSVSTCARAVGSHCSFFIRMGTVIWSSTCGESSEGPTRTGVRPLPGAGRRMTSVPRPSFWAASMVYSPSPALSHRTPSSAARPARRVDERHLVGDDEGRVEADAELADELRVLGGVSAETLEELARAGLGDGADVLDDFLPRQADAVVGDGDRARGLVVAHPNPRDWIVLEQRRHRPRPRNAACRRRPTRSTRARAGRSPCSRTRSESSDGGVA